MSRIINHIVDKVIFGIEKQVVNEADETLKQTGKKHHHGQGPRLSSGQQIEEQPVVASFPQEGYYSIPQTEVPTLTASTTKATLLYHGDAQEQYEQLEEQEHPSPRAGDKTPRHSWDGIYAQHHKHEDNEFHSSFEDVAYVPQDTIPSPHIECTRENLTVPESILPCNGRKFLTTKVSNVIMIYNPFSGNKRGEKIALKASKYLNQEGVSVVLYRSTRKGHIEEIAQVSQLNEQERS